MRLDFHDQRYCEMSGLSSEDKPRFFIAVCPSCSARLRVPRDIADSEIPCPECDAVVTPTQLRAAEAQLGKDPKARVKCPVCGANADFHANICVECGLDFRTGRQLRRARTAAEKLQRVDQRIRRVRAELRGDMKALAPHAFFVLGVFLVAAFLLWTVIPLLGSVGGLCAAVGLVSFALVSVAWLISTDRAVRLRRTRQETLTPLVERRLHLQRECNPASYWMYRLWLPVVALLGVLTSAIVLGLSWHRDARAADLDASLRSAILANEPGQVRQLLHAGAHPNSKYGPAQITPLHIAAQRGHARIVRMLIDAGARVDAVDMGGLCPLDKCVDSWMSNDTNDVSFAATVATLVDHGAELTTIRTREHPSRTDRSTLDERLGEAAERGRGRFVEFLLSAGADPNVTDLSGATPLARCIAAQHDSDTTFSVIIPLLEAGADPNLRSARWSPLHEAVEQGNVDIVVRLLEYGADPKLRHVRRTPLEIATSRGLDEMAAVLRRYLE